MRYRLLGHSELQVSEVCFGCMSLTTAHPDPASLIHRAVAGGINFFDTADLYEKGWNETMLGKALGGKRKDVMISTKVGNVWNDDGESWSWNASKEHILRATADSLRRLQTDYIDLLQLHGGTLEDNIDDVIDAFEQLQQEGKIRYYGISSIRPNVIREYVQRSRITSVMMQYSLLDRRPEESCLPLLQQHGIGVLARGSVARGLLAGKPAAPFSPYTREEVRRVADTVSQLSNDKTMAQTAMQFVLKNPAITSAVAGIRTMPQLDEALLLSDQPEPEPKDYELLCNVLPVTTYDAHR